MGSVKDLQIIQSPSSKAMGVGRFKFSDRYSVFDWGEMPDLLRQKGAALCLMGAYSFEQLQQKGLQTHYRGVVNSKGRLVTTDELDSPAEIMEVNLVNVIRPPAIKSQTGLRHDYHQYTTSLTNYLVPLEIIYRNGLPVGSSVFKRLERGEITLTDLGLDHQPKPGEHLKQPIFDVSTKLEERDRYLKWTEAQRISGLTNEEITDVKQVLNQVNQVVTQLAGRAKLVNEDGKIELAMDPKRQLMVVDVVGTLDECRFTYDTIHVSKEIARQFYKQTPWYTDVEQAKKEADLKGIEEWKGLCKSQPTPLKDTLKRIIEEIYIATANAYTKLDLFDAPKLSEVIQEYKEYLR